MVLKFYIFSAVTHSRSWRGVVMVWQVATLPMPCYIVLKITTRSVPQNLPAILGRRRRLSRCDVSCGRSFSVAVYVWCVVVVVMCGSCELKQRKY